MLTNKGIDFLEKLQRDNNQTTGDSTTAAEIDETRADNHAPEGIWAEAYAERNRETFAGDVKDILERAKRSLRENPSK